MRRRVVVGQISAVGSQQGCVTTGAQALAQRIGITRGAGGCRVVGADAVQESAGLAGAGAANNFDIVFEHEVAGVQVTDGEQTDRQIGHADHAGVCSQRCGSECDDCCDGRQFQFHLHTPVEKEEAHELKQF